MNRPGPLPWEWPTEAEDLYHPGEEACEHDFRGWQSTSGVFCTVDLDGSERIEGWMKFENRCKLCPAKVGRRLSMEVPT